MHAVVHGCTYVHTFIRVFPCIDTKSEKIPVHCVDFFNDIFGVIISVSTNNFIRLNNINCSSQESLPVQFELGRTYGLDCITPYLNGSILYS